MLPTKFTTTALPRHEQLESWCAWHSSIFDVISSPLPAANGFPATHLNWRVGCLGVSRIFAPALHSERTKSVIRRNPVDHWVVTVNKGGVVDLSTRGVSLSAPAGVPFVFSMADELSSTRSGMDRIRFFLPRDGFRGVAALLDAARGTALETSEGKLLAGYMTLLARNLPDLPPGDGPRLVNAVEAMLGACLAPSADRLAIAEKQIDLTLMERVRRAVRMHLHSPSLGPDKLCREAATSRSQLYRLLEGEGGVAHYIQHRRLSEAFTLLCDASNLLPVAKIAELLCFADASSFSRAFRREFGMSPSDVRASSLAGLAPASVKSMRHDGVHSFSDCLHGF
jgi:AraC-like DNA-binding protein